MVAGLKFLFSSFFLIHIGFGIFVLTRRDAFSLEEGGPPPEFVGVLMIVIPALCMLFAWTAAVLTIMGANRMRRRTSRTFSIVVAGIQTLFFPFGTALGVFAIIVLTRDSVRELYTRQR